MLSTQLDSLAGVAQQLGADAILRHIYAAETSARMLLLELEATGEGGQS
jgi:hypothetical protein